MQVNKCLRHRLAWCNYTNLPYDSSQEQYSLLPRAIADQDGKTPTSGKFNHYCVLLTIISMGCLLLTIGWQERPLPSSS